MWDLHFGVEPHPSFGDLADHVDRTMLDRIGAHVVGHDRVVAGHDMYPIGVHVHGARSEPLTIDERVAAYDHAARRWYDRYRRPFWVAETSNLGLPVTDGPRWLDAIVGTLDQLRVDAIPARGICWYSRGDQYDWHTMLTKPVGEVTEVGLFDARRAARPVAAAYAELTRRRGR